MFSTEKDYEMSWPLACILHSCQSHHINVLKHYAASAECNEVAIKLNWYLGTKLCKKTYLIILIP